MHTYVDFPDLSLWFVDDALVGYRLDSGSRPSAWGFPQGATVADALRAEPSIVIQKDPVEAQRLLWHIGPLDGTAAVAYGSVNDGVMDPTVTVLSDRAGPPCFD